MTDIASDRSRLTALVPAVSARQGDAKVGRSRQAVLMIVATLAVVAAWLVAALGAAPPDIDSELAMLLRFMAGVKAAIALAVLGLTMWRFGHPLSFGTALMYGAAAALMCAAPGVIAQLAHVGIGAGLFHAGVLLFVAALMLDRDGASQLVGRALRRDRRA